MEHVGSSRCAIIMLSHFSSCCSAVVRNSITVKGSVVVCMSPLILFSIENLAKKSLVYSLPITKHPYWDVFMD